MHTTIRINKINYNLRKDSFTKDLKIAIEIAENLENCKTLKQNVRMVYVIHDFKNSIISFTNFTKATVKEIINYSSKTPKADSSKPENKSVKETQFTRLVKIKNGKIVYDIFSPLEKEKKKIVKKSKIKKATEKKEYPLVVLPNYLNSYRFIDSLLCENKKIESNDFIAYCLKLSMTERTVVILSHAIGNNVLKALTTNKGNSFKNDYYKSKTNTFKLKTVNQTTEDCLSIVAEKILSIIKPYDLKAIGSKYFNDNILNTLLEYDFLKMKVNLLKIALNVPILQYNYFNKKEKKIEKVYSIISHYAWNTLFNYKKTAFNLSEKSREKLLTMQLNKLLAEPTAESRFNIESVKNFLESQNPIDYFILKKVYHGCNFTKIANQLEKYGYKKMTKQAVAYRYRKLVERAKSELKDIYIERKL